MNNRPNEIRILENLDIGFVVHAPDTSIIFTNTKAAEILGISKDQMIGRQAISSEWKLLREDNTQLPLEEYPVNQIAKTKKEIRNLLVGVQRPNIHDIRWASVNGIPNFDNNGEISEIVISFIDLTEHKAREDALRKSEERLSLALEVSRSGSWDWNIESDQRYWSKGLFHLFGLPSETTSPTAESWKKVVHPDDYEMAKINIDDAILNHKLLSYEYRVVWPNGATRWLSATGRCQYDHTGKPIRLIGICTDITERKISEEEHATLAAIVTNSAEAIISKDLNDTIKSWNLGAERLFGYTAQEALGSQGSIITPPDRHNEEQDILLRLKNGKRIEYLETVRITKDHRQIDVSISSSPMIDNQGRIIGTAKIIRDITDRKRAELQLFLLNTELTKAKAIAECANAAKSSFLSNMSHEIRTPMNAIIGMTDLLSETKLDDKQIKYIDILKKAGLGLLLVIDDVLDISKIESGKLAINNAEFNLKVLTKEVVELLHNQAEEKKLILTLFFSPDTPEYLLCDDFRIKQILTNLLGNSIKFTQTGSIIIKIGKNADQSKKGNLVFTVTDTGIGITKECQHKLFQTYTQADSTTTKSYGGSGLGLAISKRLVELMGGEIWLESQEGKGTTVSFTLGCTEIKGPDTKPEAPLMVARKSNNDYKSKILLVDDADFNRILIQEYLKNTNYIITEAENGKIAIDKAKEEDFDLILMDMQMPVMDGYTATKEIRVWEQQTNHAHIPIVAITAYALKEEQEKSLAVGCDQHLSKPLLKENLMDVLNRIGLR